MKLNNKGFAISSIMYIILIMAVILISVTLAILSSRKLILDKIKKETADNIYGISYNSVINTLKHEAINYASSNNVEQENIKIGDFETSVSQELLEHHELSDKYLTLSKTNYSYDVYLGQTKKVTDISKPIDNMLGIVDYKIEGNSFQEVRSGKNLFKINNLESTSIAGLNYEVTDGTLKISGTQTDVFTQLVPCNLMLKANTKYSLSLNLTGTIDGNNPFFYFSEDTTPKVDDDIYIAKSAMNKVNFTVEEDTTINYLIIQSSIKDTVWQDVELKIQLEEGSTVTTYEPYGESPSPEFPSEIQSVGDKTKNIFDLSNINLTDVSTTITFISDVLENGFVITTPSETYEGNGYTNTQIKLRDMCPEIEVGKAYALNFDYTAPITRLENAMYLNNLGLWYVGQSKVITEEMLDDYVIFYGKITPGTENRITNIMLSEENVEYEPYGYKIPVKVSNGAEEITTNIYLNEPLRKITDYRDSVDYSNKIVSKKIGQVIYNGSESWRFYPQGNGYMISNDLFIDGQPIISNMFMNSQILTTKLAIRKNYVNIYAYGIRDYYKTSEEWGSFLTNNNMEVIGKLVSPSNGTTTTLPQIQTNIGSSIIEVDTSIQPSSVEFTVIEKIRKL